MRTRSEEEQLFSALMPKHLWTQLPWPSYGASEAEILTHEQAFNERSRWRFQLHAGPDAEGIAPAWALAVARHPDNCPDDEKMLDIQRKRRALAEADVPKMRCKPCMRMSTQ